MKDGALRREAGLKTLPVDGEVCQHLPEVRLRHLDPFGRRAVDLQLFAEHSWHSITPVGGTVVAGALPSVIIEEAPNRAEEDLALQSEEESKMEERMYLAAEAWLRDNPKEARELAAGADPYVYHDLLAATHEAAGPLGAPVALRMRLIGTVQALAAHGVDEYRRQRSAALEYGRATSPTENTPVHRPHVCRCIWETFGPESDG